MFQARIGIDIGGVLTARHITSRDDDTDMTKKYLQKPEFAGAIAGVRSIVTACMPVNVFIISRCSIAVEEKTKEWLKYRKFYKKTGFLPENVHFCRERAEKATIAKKLKLTHFIDDQPEVLYCMKNIVPYRFLFGRSSEAVINGLFIVPDWPATVKRILATL